MVKHIQEILHTVRNAAYQPHLILVDDGSDDNTWCVIQTLSERYGEIEGIRLSRNFGKDNALFAGLHYTYGEAVITIDSDGQHPVSLIPTILKAWQEGAMVVHAVKQERRGETLGMRMRAAAFNFVMSKLMNANQGGASDFKLLDRRVAAILCQHETSSAIYRYSVANLGFPCANIPMNTLPVDRPTRWRITSLFQVAIRAIMFHTDIPLKAFVALTILVVAMSLGLMVALLVAFFHGNVPTGYSTLLMLNLLTLGITVLGLTGLAVYLKGTLDVVARRSAAIVWQQTSTKRSL
jgi:glycosyltransferase involved in cell wall biosynthesis